MAGSIEIDSRQTELTETEFKANLYTSLQNKGILDSLKSQLRCLMVREIQGTNDSTSNGDAMGGGLLLRVANDVVASHLNRNGYEFTLSTFLPEARIRINESLSCRDLVHFLHVHTDHPIAESLETSERGFLMPLLESISQSYPPSLAVAKPTLSVESVGVQTDSFDGEGVGVAHLEGRMLAFQREVESRNKKLLESEVKRFKEKETALIRMEERNKHLKQVSETKEKLELQYKERVAQARRGIEEDRERLKRREAELEDGLFTQRQVLLEEMEVLKLREMELKRQMEVNKRSAVLEQEKVHSLQEVLKGKDALLDDIKRQYEGMSEARVTHCMMEQETKDIQEQQRRKQVEQELQVERDARGEAMSQCEELRSELAKEREASQSLNRELVTATERQNDLLKHIKTLENKIRQQKQIIDSSIMSTSRTPPLHVPEKQTNGEVEKLHMTVSELQSTLGHMKQESSSNHKEKEALEQLVIKTNQEKMALNYDNRQLRKEITEKTNTCLHLQQTYDQQTIILQSAYREIDDLQEQVEQLQQLLLDRVGNPQLSNTAKVHTPPRKDKTKLKKTKKGSPTKRASLDLSSSSNPSPLPPLPSTRQPSSLLTAAIPTTRSFSDSSAILLTEARATFVRLENEAKNLERNYEVYKPSTRETPILLHYPTNNETMGPLHCPPVMTPSALPQPYINNTASSLSTVPIDTVSLHSTSVSPVSPPFYSADRLPMDSSITATTGTAYSSSAEPLVTAVSTCSSVVTTPTQYNATPLSSATEAEHTSSRKSSTEKYQHDDPPQALDQIITTNEPVLSLDDLWKRDIEPSRRPVSPEDKMGRRNIVNQNPTGMVNQTTDSSHVINTLSHVTTQSGHVTYIHDHMVTSSNGNSTRTDHVTVEHKEDDADFAKWQREREEKKRQREEEERLERDRAAQELLEMERQALKSKITPVNNNPASIVQSEQLSGEEEASNGEEDALKKYIKLVQQARQTEGTATKHSEHTPADKEPLSLSLGTKSVSHDEEHSVGSAKDGGSDTFDEW